MSIKGRSKVKSWARNAFSWLKNNLWKLQTTPQLLINIYFSLFKILLKERRSWEFFCLIHLRLALKLCNWIICLTAYEANILHMEEFLQHSLMKVGVQISTPDLQIQICHQAKAAMRCSPQIAKEFEYTKGRIPAIPSFFLSGKPVQQWTGKRSNFITHIRYNIYNPHFIVTVIYLVLFILLQKDWQERRTLQ